MMKKLIWVILLSSLVVNSSFAKEKSQSKRTDSKEVEKKIDKEEDIHEIKFLITPTIDIFNFEENTFNSAVLNNYEVKYYEKEYNYSIGYALGKVEPKAHIIGTYLDIELVRENRDFNVSGISLAPCNDLGRIIGLQTGVYSFAHEGAVCFQMSAHNKIGEANYVSQVGFWNEITNENADNNIQLGLINSTAGDSFQLGLLNFSKKGFLKFFPFINF
ncbi:hypothetical protein AAEX28_05960 [Lentisphaerota bacterium WC36G]|nr:hypothetical protein LJT99_08820 [Lentisphaerae bacterium WC36]